MMNFIRSSLIIFLCSLLSACATVPESAPAIQCPAPKVPVYGYAQAFVGDAPVRNAKITVLETGQTFTTNQVGRFAFCTLPRQQITLLLNKSSQSPLDNFYPVQSATVQVPTHGLRGKFQEITFQVPREMTFNVLKEIFSYQHHIELNPNRCTVGATLTAFNKTLADDPQGEPGSTILLWHNNRLIKNPPVFYVGILFGKTDPLQTNLKSSSADGGAIIYNLPPSNKLYYLSASKPGKRFSTVAFLCRANSFINLSPPYGPRVL